MSYQLTYPILHCLRQRAAVLGHSDSWDWVLRDPVVGVFSPALHLLVQEGHIHLDEQLIKTSRDIYWGLTANWVRREAAFKKLLSALMDAGIDVIPLKGAALLETVYPGIGLRNMADLDILVREADFLPAAEVLLANGQQPRWSDPSGDLFAFTQLAPQFWPGELSFYHQDKLLIDLHQNLITYHWFKHAYPLDIEAVWDRAVSTPSPTGSGSLPWTMRLSPYDMLGHLCLHLALHGMQIVKNLFDIDQFLRQLPDDWDWKRYLHLADGWGLRSVSYHGFAFSQALFDTPVPPDVMLALTPAVLDRWLVRCLITPDALLRGKVTIGVRYPTLVKFALFDGIRIKLKTLARLFFPGKAWLRNNPDYHNVFQHWLHLAEVILRGD